MTAPAEGYLGVDIHAATAAKVKALGGGEWRAPIHGTSVMVAPDGSVLAYVRTLGIRMPASQRRYSLRVKGVMFTRIVPLLSKTKPIRSGLAPYDSMKRAQAVGSDLVRQMIEGAATPAHEAKP